MPTELPTLPAIEQVDSCAEDAPHIFTKEELAACANGQCCNCGRCCCVFNVYVPSQVGQALLRPEQTGRVPLVVLKLSGVMCHQAQEVRGLFLCGLHDQKHLPILDDCRRWDGTSGGYQVVVELTRERLFQPKNVSEVARLEYELKRGLLSDVPPVATREELETFLTYHLSCGRVSTELFAHAGVWRMLDACTAQERLQIGHDLSRRLPNVPGVPPFVDQYLSDNHENSRIA